MRGLQISDEIKFKASGDSKLLANRSSNPLVLNLKGILIDAIQAVGTQFESRQGETLRDEPYMPDVGMRDLFRYPGQYSKISVKDKAVGSLFMFEEVRISTMNS